MAKTMRFEDKMGNKFLFPALIQWGEEDDISSFDMNSWAMTISLKFGDELRFEPFEFDAKAFPHVRTELVSSAFVHGAATVLLFEGPDFEEAKSAAVQP